jgi:tRNA-dihydrouridine synthase
MDAFRYCLEVSKAPVCYNGNLTSISQIEAFRKEFPQVQSVMIGRGLVGDPGMLTPGGTTVDALDGFMERLAQDYCVVFGSERNAMFRLKENWRHLLCRFEGSEKLGKRLRKTTDIREYRAIVQEILHTLPLAPQLNPDW